MKKITSVAAGAAIAATFATGSAVASENPFTMQQVSSVDTVAMSEGTCGEGKCGDNKGKDSKGKEGKCGDGKSKDKGKEGKCGGK